MAAGLARSISNAALVVMGNSLALDNPPIRVAEEFAMLNVLNGGRLIAGPDKPLVWRENLVLSAQPGAYAQEERRLKQLAFSGKAHPCQEACCEVAVWRLDRRRKERST